VRWVIGAAMIVEIACIIMQSARGVPSHFNDATVFDRMIFGVMGTTILINTIVMVVFFAIIRRDTPPRRAGYVWGIRLGVLIFLLASAEGAIIVANNAHTVGAADGGPGLPFVNWSTQSGDLRIAHFFGMHAMQVLPLVGFILDRSLPRRSSWVTPGNLVIATSILWVAAMSGLLLMALRGQPLLAL
jgi:hypothetical protein